MFSVSNKHFVGVFFWPLPGFIELPVYILGLGILVAGIIIGYLAGYFKTKFTSWRNQKEHFK
jgi:uncharacterized integral membrane protein